MKVLLKAVAAIKVCVVLCFGVGHFTFGERPIPELILALTLALDLVLDLVLSVFVVCFD